MGAPYKIIKDHKGVPTHIQMEWEIDDAQEIGYVIQRAGVHPGGKIRDQGFYDDGEIILVAVEEARAIINRRSWRMIYERKNAKIRSTFLGPEDNGIFTFALDLDYGGKVQGAGGYGLIGSGWSNPKAMELIARILEVCGVRKWEDLPGRPIVAICDAGYGGLVRGLASFIGDKEVMFGEVLESDRGTV